MLSFIKSGVLRMALISSVLAHATACAPLPPPLPTLVSVAVSTVSTVFGDVGGLDLGNGVTRFTLPFAQPPVGDLRVANPQLINNLVSGFNVSNTPPACYQGSGDPRGGNAPSEDCLYATYYKPSKAKATDRLPIHVWIHGGSGIVGSSTGAGLDGSVFAHSQNVIVVLLQYRLGLFGWLQTGTTLDEAQGGGPGSSTVGGNQAMRDVVMALKQVKAMAPLIGGDTSKVVLMGQSSGASMVRALLITPAAKGLFTHAVLVSDPANYGITSIANNNALGEYGMGQLKCDLADIGCARRASADQVLDATLASYSKVPSDHPGISAGTPWTAMKGNYVTGSIERGQKTDIPVIMTTVANEAGTVTAFTFEPSLPNATVLTYAYSDGQTATMAEGLETIYSEADASLLVNQTDVYPIGQGEDGIRQTFEATATDGLWRCSTQYNAQQLASLGDRVWLAQWNVGTTYPSNKQADYCTKENHVCHEDDIYTVFGTAPAPSPAVKQLSMEFQARLASFARSGQPDAPGAVSWPSIQSASNLNLLSLGVAGSEEATSSVLPSQRPDACRQLWGDVVKFDWQSYES